MEPWMMIPPPMSEDLERDAERDYCLLGSEIDRSILGGEEAAGRHWIRRAVAAEKWAWEILIGRDAQFAEYKKIESALAHLQSAKHASAPQGHKCAYCTMDDEPCPLCYVAWWNQRHPNVQHVPPITASRSAESSEQ